ncbi:lipase [Aphelenchoides avenae]|nr:lipase [Aphelenchus avenae]
MHLRQMVALAVVVFLAVPGAMAWTYDHELVKNKFYPLAAATWSHDGGGTCARLAFPDAKVKMYTFDTGRYALYGVTAVSHQERVIAVSFRGTTGAANLMDELIGWLKDQAEISASQGGVGKGNVKVMSYFHDAWTALFLKKMYPDVFELIGVNHKYEIWVTGHSLGGALATLTARWLSGDVGSQAVKLVTFGQPRTGTKGFADDIERKVPNHWRVFRKDDYITFLPPRCNGFNPFENAAKEIVGDGCLRNGFSHLPNAIKYKFPMGPNNYETACDDRYLFCTQVFEGGKEMAKNPKNLLTAHHMYFGKHVSNWGSGNCKDGGSQRRGGVRERTEENQVQALVLLLARRGLYGPEAKKQAMSINANKKSMLSVVQRLRKAGIPGF